MNETEKSALTEVLNEISKDLKKNRKKSVSFFRIILLLGIILFLGFQFISSLPRPSVAIISIKGLIAEDEPANALSISDYLNQAFYHPAIEAIVLDINSGGGSPVQSAQILREINYLKSASKKPVYAVISDVGASGAYYIAVGADKIYADPSSIVGSIGVISQQLAYQDLMEKVGLENRTFTAGEHKDFLSGSKPLNPKEVAHMEALLKNMHEQFISAVKKGRGDKLKGHSDELFSGLFWTGEQAKELGLIDELASLSEVLRQPQLKDLEIIRYEDELPFIEQLKRGVNIQKALLPSQELNIK